jgi:hypothetical protein
MFTADAIIDTVQTGKKTFVNTFVTNEATKEAMIKFIDAQADYTKRATKVGMDTVATLTSEAVKAVQDAAKFDYFKSCEDFFKALKPATSKK